MDVQDPTPHPSPFRVGIQCALAVIAVACAVLFVRYFPEDWLVALAANKDASDEAFMAMIHSLVVPWWLVLLAVSVHIWTVAVAWRLRAHPNAESKGFKFFRKTFKDLTESTALLAVGLYAHLQGSPGADVFFLISMLFIIPRGIRAFFEGKANGA